MEPVAQHNLGSGSPRLAPWDPREWRARRTTVVTWRPPYVQMHIGRGTSERMWLPVSGCYRSPVAAGPRSRPSVAAATSPCCHAVATGLDAGWWQRAAQILVAISLPRERETPPRGARAFR